MEVKFNKRDYLNPYFLNKIVRKNISVVRFTPGLWGAPRCEYRVEKELMRETKKQIEYGNTIIDLREMVKAYLYYYGYVIESKIFKIEPLYARYYLIKYVDVFIGIPEIVYCMTFTKGDKKVYRPKYENITKRFSLQELQEMVFKHRVLPLHQLFGHYLGNYILETHIAKSL